MKNLFTKEEILTLAKEKGIKLSYLNNLIGGYRGKMTDWKNGKTTLTNDELTVITKYLSVYENLSLNDSEKLLISKYRSLSDEKKENLLKELSEM